MRKVSALVLFVLAGFLLSITTVTAFIGGLPLSAKVAVLLMFAGAAVVPHLLGLALAGFRYWRRYTGIVLLSVAAYTAFAGFSLACIYFSDEARLLLPQQMAMAFGSLPGGLALLTASAVLGWLLLQSSAKRPHDSR